MASVKDLKKSINYVTSEVITEAYVRKMLFDDIKEEDFSKILTDAIEVRNDLIAKVNHPDGKDNPKKVKAYYNKIKEEMNQRFEKIIEAINKLK